MLLEYTCFSSTCVATGCVPRLDCWVFHNNSNFYLSFLSSRVPCMMVTSGRQSYPFRRRPGEGHVPGGWSEARAPLFLTTPSLSVPNGRRPPVREYPVGGPIIPCRNIISSLLCICFMICRIFRKDSKNPVPDAIGSYSRHVGLWTRQVGRMGTSLPRCTRRVGCNQLPKKGSISRSSRCIHPI